jgi:asparagine synthase (glutamine-hydrolysing)
MPGLFGFSKNYMKDSTALNVAEDMRTLITHKRSYVCDEIYRDDYICAGRSNPNVIQKECQPFSRVNEKVHVWLDGEFYDIYPSEQNITDRRRTDTEVLSDLYIQNYRKVNDWKFLAHIDGSYSAVIWDETNKKIHLISDRYSSVLLYCALLKHNFIWGTELKIFPAHPYFSLDLDQETIDEFITLGISFGDKTWFRNVKRMPAATVISFDVSTFSVTSQRYWWWDEISLLKEDTHPEDICEELGNRFIRSVADRLIGDERIELSLSGGVDSRAILAALPERKPPVVAYTFGRAGSYDVKIAKKYARMKGIKHRILDISVENWLQGRIKCIWWIDGCQEVLSMHGASIDNRGDEYNSIVLVGLFPEVLKGLHRYVDANNVNEFIAAKRNAQIILDLDRPKVIERFVDYIKSTGTNHIYQLDYFVKNFSAFGYRLGIIDGSQIRTPFSANRLQEYIYSIPSHSLKRPDIYHGMLLLKFPMYFNGISCGTVNIPTSNYHKLVKTYNRVTGGLSKRAKKYGFFKPKSKYFALYSVWIRTGIGKNAFEKILNNKNAIYNEFIPDTYVSKYFESHVNGENHTNLLSRFFTLEIWLQQLINKKYRTTLDE